MSNVNASGLAPVDMRIVVKPDLIEEKTAGGVFIPGASIDKQKYAATKATIVAVGPNAFKDWGTKEHPTPGQRVLFAQYTGAREKGRDGEDYVVMNDADLLAVIEESK